MQSIVRRRASQTTGDVAAASTVGIDLRRHQLEGTYIEFYDCAGQLDYLGMHQTFLSRRALYLLVWDIQNFQNDRREELDDVSTEVKFPALMFRRFRDAASIYFLGAVPGSPTSRSPRSLPCETDYSPSIASP